MLTNRISIIAILALIVLLNSCAKEGPTGPIGPAGPNYYGTIAGHVSLYDQYGSRVLTGLDSATLTLVGQTVPTTVVTSTDANGYYNITNVPSGSYNLTTSRPNYATTMKSNFSFFDGTLTEDVKLSAIPDSFLNSFTIIHSPGSVFDSLVVSVTANPYPRSCIVFVNNNSAVSSNEYVGYTLNYVQAIPPNSTTVYIPVSRNDLTNAGFISGSTLVYYAAYSYVVNDFSVYEDQASGKKVYNAVNATALIDSAIVP